MIKKNLTTKTFELHKKQHKSIQYCFTNWIQKAQKHGRSACSYCPRDRECIPRNEEGCRHLLWSDQSVGQSIAKGLLLKVLQSRVWGRMYKWIHCFLQDRSARVKLDGYMSESFKMREGVPQGGVISPTLFLLYINILPRQMSNTVHADDHAVCSTADNTTSAA